MRGPHKFRIVMKYGPSHKFRVKTKYEPTPSHRHTQDEGTRVFLVDTVFVCFMVDTELVDSAVDNAVDNGKRDVHIPPQWPSAAIFCS